MEAKSFPVMAAASGHRWARVAPTVFVASSVVGVGTAVVGSSDVALAVAITVGAFLVIGSVALGLVAPRVLFGLYLFGLGVSPTVQIAGLSVSPVDPVALGALVATAVHLRKRSIDPVGIAAVAWITVMIASLIPSVMASNPVAIQNLLRVARISTVLLPTFLSGAFSISYLAALRLLVVGTSIGVMSGLAQVYLGLNIAAADQYIYLPGGTIHRAAGFYGEASTFGDMGAIDFLAAVLALLHATQARDRLLALCAVPVGLLALVLGFSRSSFVFCLIGLGIIVLLTGRLRGRFVIPIAVAVIGGATTYFLEPRLVEAFVAQRLGLISVSTLSAPTDLTSGRLGAWPAILGRFWEQPDLWLFGIGYKMLALDPGNPVRFGPADNNYITILVETGILGLGAFAAWLWGLAKALMVLISSPARTLTAALLGGLAVESLTSDAFTYYRVVGILTLLYVCAKGARSVRE